jgi:hypothetical protein
LPAAEKERAGLRTKFEFIPKKLISREQPKPPGAAKNRRLNRRRSRPPEPARRTEKNFRQ